MSSVNKTNKNVSKEVELLVLKTIAERGPMSIKELSEHLGMKVQTLSVIVGRMVTKGLLAKENARKVVREWGRYSSKDNVYFLRENIPKMKYIR